MDDSADPGAIQFGGKPLLRPDGTPARAADFTEGKIYAFDPVTGVMSEPSEEEAAMVRAASAGLRHGCDERPIDPGVTRDLMTKVADDVTQAIMRTVRIAPKPWLPIVMAAAGAALCAAGAEIDHITGDPNPESDPNSVLLGALMAVEALNEGGGATERALKKFEALKAAGLTAPERRVPAPARRTTDKPEERTE